MVEHLFLVPAYSNAVLLAILPHVSEFAAKLDLPIKQPVTTEQVRWCRPVWFSDTRQIEGGICLTNGDSFAFSSACGIISFRALDSPYAVGPDFDIMRYYGHDHMTTNEAITLARDALRKLGYTPAQTHSSGRPTEWEGPFDAKRSWQEPFKPGHVPYCRANWEWPPRDTAPPGCFNRVEVEINMDKRRLAGMFLLFSRTNVSLPIKPIKFNLPPDFDSQYPKLVGRGGGMFLRSNAPPRFPGVSPPPGAPAPSMTNAPPPSAGKQE